MFDLDAITKAVDTQRRAYALLRWLETAMDKGFIRIGAAHVYATATEAGVAWCREHFENLPREGRPASRSEEDLRTFANMLVSFLESSFDLLDDPGADLRTDCGCWCPICTYTVRGRYFVTKKVTDRDKTRARRLMEDRLRELSMEAGRELTEREARDRVESGEYREELALLAYGRELLKRMEGVSEGPAVLALWRLFAWERSGSPKKGFMLTPDLILQAEERLKEVL